MEFKSTIDRLETVYKAFLKFQVLIYEKYIDVFSILVHQILRSNSMDGVTFPMYQRM